MIWRRGRKSRHSLERAELDAGFCEMSVPVRAKSEEEMEAARTSNELPATPLTMSSFGFEGPVELA